jgi:hypothetical protein
VGKNAGTETSPLWRGYGTMRAERVPASRKGEPEAGCRTWVILRLTRAAKEGPEGGGADGTAAIGMCDSGPRLPSGCSGLRRGPTAARITERENAQLSWSKLSTSKCRFLALPCRSQPPLAKPSDCCC